MMAAQEHKPSMSPSNVYVRDIAAWNKMRLALSRAEYVAIVGPKYSGKTLLLRDSIDKLREDEEYSCVYVDLDTWRVYRLRELLQALAEVIQTAVSACGQPKPLPSLESIQDGQDFRRFLSSLLSGVPHTIVVTLDHIQSLPRYLAKALLRCFRVIYSERDVHPEYYRLIVVAAGALNLFDLTVSHISPFNIATLIPMSGPTEEQSRELIEGVSKHMGVPFSTNAISRIQEIAGGDYYLIQHVCQLAAQQPRWTSHRVAKPAVERALAIIEACDPMSDPCLAERIRVIEADPLVLKTVLEVLARREVKRRELLTDIDSLELTGFIKVIEHRYVVCNEICKRVLQSYFTPRRVARLFTAFGRWNDAIQYFEQGDPFANRTERAEYLAAVVNHIYGEEDEESAFRCIARALEKGFRVQHMVIYRTVQSNQGLVPVAWHGLDSYSQGAFISLHDRSDLPESRAHHANDYLLEEDGNGNSLFVLPLSGGRLPTVGIVTLYNHFPLDCFVEQREEVLEIIGFLAQAGRAIASLRERQELYAQTQELAVAQERQRLARDLHDAVTQTLFSANVIAGVLPRLWERDPDQGRRRLDELQQLTQGALAEMRTLLVELRPAALIETELESLLRYLAEAVSAKAKMPITVTVKGKHPVPDDVKVTLYRIAQEALNNVAKYANARQAAVNLDCEVGQVTLQISDDGRGFDPEETPPQGLGLSIMRERAEAIGAVLGIKSRPDKGTLVSVRWSDATSFEQPP